METLDAFEAYLQTLDRSPLTVRGYLSDLHAFARWFKETNGEAFAPQAVTPVDIREYRGYLLNVARRKASTVNRKLAAIAKYLEWAVAEGLLDSNPAHGVRLLKQVARPPRWLDRKAQYALRRAIEKDLQLSKLRYPVRYLTRQRDATMVILLLNTGLRVSELLSLRTGDITLSQRKGRIRVMGKGGKERTVPLNAEARQALRNWLDVRPDSTDWVFTAIEQDSANRLDARTLQRAVHRLAQAAGLQDLTPHTLRHTFAKNLVDAEVSLEKVAALLGHSSLNTTRLYITPGERDLERAVDALR